MKLIDLSVTLEPVSSEPIPVDIHYISHEQGADILGKPAGIDRKAFPDSKGISLEHIKLTSHSGTHVDAPAHYGPICEGKPARTIEQMPLHWFFSDGVMIDCSDGAVDRTVSQAELQQKLADIEYVLKPYDIVLLQTGADKHWGQPEYFTDFRGVSREATEWLVKQGIRVIGIDSFGFDPPFHRMLSDYHKWKCSDVLWPAHIYGREREYCQIERLVNLCHLPVNYGFKITCFPIKIRGCGAGWSRVVAIVDA